ncbi:glutathionylspermidine synthase family protein [Dehalobacter sp. DCM]|uniref:glutathionylspermidine synthase family protein n=1 Tax=Dehalobacter sp. DCM TaxID=2907827 RepID=UPI0030812B1A|nr:glutathionylspermidine synthase family protein [Dehalobacter sp. DCM]
MSTEQLFEKYQQRVLANADTYIASYKQVFEEVAHSVAEYKDKPVEFLYQPMFLTETDIRRFTQLTHQLYGILEKVICKYLEDENFRVHFGFDPLLEALILKDPGYEPDIPIGRFDIFYNFDSGRFQFCELNTDGSSGMIEQQELARIFKASTAIKEIEKTHTLQDFELFDSWVQIVKNKYAEFSRSNDLPQVALVDWFSGKIPSEFIEYQKAFQRAGCPTRVVDVRSLDYRDGKLYHENFRIDCVYRRLVTAEAMAHADACKPFFDAYLNGDVCVVGPFRSQIAHNKVIFALLHDVEKTPFLSEEDRDFIREHIPYTRIFDSGDPQMVMAARENKDQLVLKPMDKYASHGVRIGRDYTSEQWEGIIREEAGQDYLLQEFCIVPKLPMAFFNRENVRFIDSNYIIGLYLYDGKFQGIYTRAGTKNIIGSIVECFTVPNFVVR